MRNFFGAIILLWGSTLFGQGTRFGVDSGFVKVNGTTLYYEIAGFGEPLVLIHGSFGDRRHWELQFSNFARKFKVLRYDLRGFGRSENPDTVTVYKDADDLKALLDYLNIPKANICGLSSGSVVVIDFGLAYPEKCLSLIAVGPRVAGDDADEYKTPATDSLRAAVASVVNIMKAKGKREAIESLWKANNALSNSVKAHSTRQYLLEIGYDYSWSRYLYPNKRQFVYPMAIKKLNEINIPTLVITAEHDIKKCKEVADILKNNIPGARIISIKGAGHIMNMDRPRRFNDLISKFINQE